MPVISDKDTLLIRCVCHGHVLEISNEDYDIDGIESQIAISVWNQTPIPFSFLQRLKLIWTLLRGKNLDGGDVIIESEDAVRIIQFLSKKIVENQTKLAVKRKNSCCDNEKRNMNGGCDNCGDPCY